MTWKHAIITVSILVAAFILTKMVRWLIQKSFDKASDKIKMDATKYKFFKNAASLIIWIIAVAAIVSTIPELKTLAITLFAGAGIMVAVIGFAAQSAFSNIISGIFVVMFKPFRVGDLIKVGGLDYGVVEDITLRHTVLVNFQNKRIIIPNSVISSENIINDLIEDARVCRWIDVGISYDSDIDLAMNIMREEAMKHPFCIDGRTPEQKAAGEPVVVVRMIGFGDSSVNLRAFVWIADPMTGLHTQSDISMAIKKRFDSEGIEIPFPYRTVVYKNDLHPNA